MIIDSNKVLIEIKETINEELERHLNDIKVLYHYTDDVSANKILSSKMFLFKMASCYKSEIDFKCRYDDPFFISCFSENKEMRFKNRNTKLTLSFDNIKELFDKNVPILMKDGDDNEYNICFVGRTSNNKDGFYENNLLFSVRYIIVDYNNETKNVGIDIDYDSKIVECAIENEVCNYVKPDYKGQKEIRFVGELKSVKPIEIKGPVKIFVKLNSNVDIKKEKVK